MERRTQADRSAATRAALVTAGRELFATHGFNGVGTEALTSAANVSRGALYHQYGDKVELFASVLTTVESEVTERVAAEALSSGETEFAGLMRAALDSWFDACEAPEVQRIVLLDGPAVLGWARWRELCQPYILDLIEGLLRQAIDDGSIEALPTRPLAHALVAMADEAALYVLAADDRPRARAEMSQVFHRLAAGLVTATADPCHDR
ncbi:TetR/AcrR family transcriptional regulator [Nocardioides sp. NPDC047086]|uniref:TetR/AcrR family transcriptional regulator n=1 Tax=Nocardioides sp. NPDC047086 TaxID=3154810 RepID=UPI0033E9DD6F